jgi:mannitol-1-phosphate 5-dehydrogenase
MTGKIVVFGAGATGRGHVGLLSWQAGFEIVFVDKNLELCELLQRNGTYRVRLYGNGCEEINVSGFRVFHSEDRQAVANEIATSDLVLTAVFDQNLQDVAKTLALAVTTCKEQGRINPLNVIACENMMDSSSTLGRHVRGLLPEDELDYFDTFFGFPDCMISRVVPRPEPDPLLIITEDYNEWTTRAEAFKGNKPPALTSLELVDNQTARLERKLFIHNGGHAICGYMGYHRHWTYIHEALTDPVVTEHVLGALDELGEVIQRKHHFSRDSIEKYKQDLGHRGAIPEMRDAVVRVVRDPIRKLSSRERLVAPGLAAVELGLPSRWIAKGIVAVLKYQNPADAQSIELASKLNQSDLKGVLFEVCSIPPESPLCEEIEQAWREWKYS